MTNEYELADDNRANLIYEKQDLLAPLLPGMIDTPHPIYPGTTEKDYYSGEVTGSHPSQQVTAVPGEDATLVGTRGHFAGDDDAVDHPTTQPAEVET
jgi:hypothetical protein